MCFEPFPRQALQPGISPNLMTLCTVMRTALDFTSWALEAAPFQHREEREPHGGESGSALLAALSSVDPSAKDL